MYSKKFHWFHHFLLKKWYFDRLYNQLIGQPVLMFSYLFAYKTIDRGFIETFGPTFIKEILYDSTYFIKDIQSGSFYNYITFFIFGLLIITLIIICFSFFITKIVFLFNLIILLVLSDSVTDYLTIYE